MNQLIDNIKNGYEPDREEYISLLSEFNNNDISEYLFEKARNNAQAVFGNKIYIRGLIEISSYCKNNCYYCGIRCGNKKAERYRLTKDEILECCGTGYSLGFRTFVLQGGEDDYFSDDRLCDIVSEIREKYKDCAITLSVGERSFESYKRLFDAGANRYLLRHETATNEHYGKLHPKELLLENRMECLQNLKKIGYQVGTGFMVGSPYQTVENLADDVMFIQKFKPHMVGIGPFLPHKDTPFGEMKAGNLSMTLFLIGILRLVLPNSLIPATTALGTLDANGRELGILAGANVVMPNLSPLPVRGKYLLYNNKIATGEEAAESLEKLNKRLEKIGYQTVTDRGDYKK